MGGPALTAELLALAHGSREPAAQRVVEELAELVARGSGIPVRVGYLDHGPPEAGAVVAGATPGSVVVPMTLSRGYHVRHDVTPLARSAGMLVGRPLGPHRALCAPLLDGLRWAGAPERTPIVLAAAGSTDPAAVADVEAQARLLRARTGVPVLVGYASARRPTVGEAVAELARRTGMPVAVASYLLVPGTLLGRLNTSGASWVGEPLGAHPAVAAVVRERYRRALAAGRAPRSPSPRRYWTAAPASRDRRSPFGSGSEPVPAYAGCS